VGISADQVDQQREFDELNDLGFTLLSDADRVIGPRFGAERPDGPTYRRLTFVIDRDFTVIARIQSDADMEAHANLALEALRAGNA
jgi:peroxiredoxin Q/BCP